MSLPLILRAEGFAIYAAFSEAALGFAADGKLDAQQVAALHRLLRTVSPLIRSDFEATVQMTRRPRVPFQWY